MQWPRLIRSDWNIGNILRLEVLKRVVWVTWVAANLAGLNNHIIVTCALLPFKGWSPPVRYNSSKNEQQCQTESFGMNLGTTARVETRLKWYSLANHLPLIPPLVFKSQIIGFFRSYMWLPSLLFFENCSFSAVPRAAVLGGLTGLGR